MNIDLNLLWAVGAALVSIGITYGVMRQSMKTVKSELHELRNKKPTQHELLEYRVNEHDSKIHSIESDVEMLKLAWIKIESKIDYMYEKMKNQ